MNGLLVNFGIGEEQDALDGVTQFAQVAGPIVVSGDFDSSGQKCFGLPTILLAETGSEVCGKEGNVAGTYAQWRESNGENEGDDDANANANGTIATDAPAKFAPSSRTRSNSACMTAGKSPISSRKRAPEWCLLELAGMARGSSGEGASLWCASSESNMLKMGSSQKRNET